METPPTPHTCLQLAAEVDNALYTDLLGVRFPSSVDNEHGGFHSHFARDWQQLSSDGVAIDPHATILPNDWGATCQ